MKKRQTLSQKTLLRAERFEVKEDKVLIENGGERVYHNVYKRPAVSVFPVTETHEIYLIREFRFLYNKTILEAVAGYMDENESPLAAARRELKEEAGFTASLWNQLVIAEVAASVIKGQQYLFLARKLRKGESLSERHEQIELVKMTLNEAVDKVMLGEITNSSTMIGILMLDRLRRGGKL